MLTQSQINEKILELARTMQFESNLYALKKQVAGSEVACTIDTYVDKLSNIVDDIIKG